MESDARGSGSANAAKPLTADDDWDPELGDMTTSYMEDDDESCNSDDYDDEAQSLMKDHLDLMLEIVMRIREDEEFAMTIYDDCPRLQHLLDQHPDLRPIFEDPHLVLINFEKVYRDAGGVLPWDEPKKPSWLSRIVNHPCFKLLRFLILIKKVMNCVMGGGINLLTGCVKGCVGAVCFEEAADMVADNQGGSGPGSSSGPNDPSASKAANLAEAAEGHDGGDGGGGPDDFQGSPENAAGREALNRAAEYMEDPDVQDRMNELLEMNDPEALEDAIENDPELKALRDSNPLCAELMADPDTMRILVDPDNLRALGQCSDLIEQDFANPDWSPPDAENHGLEPGGTSEALEAIGETDLEGGEGGDVDLSMDDRPEDVEADLENDGQEEFEDEEDDDEGMEYELGDDGGAVRDADPNAASRGSRSSSSRQQQESNEDGQGGGGSMGGMATMLGTGLVDMLAAELVGVSVGELTGGGDGLDNLDKAADEADKLENAVEAVEAVDRGTDAIDHVDRFEEGMDVADNVDSRSRNAAMVGGAVGGGAAVAGAGRRNRNRNRDLESGEDDSDSDDEGIGNAGEGEVYDKDLEEEGKKKGGRFRFAAKAIGTLRTAAKEYVASTILGEDMAEMLVEKMEDKKKKGDDDSVCSKDESENNEGWNPDDDDSDDDSFVRETTMDESLHLMESGHPQDDSDRIEEASDDDFDPSESSGRSR